MASLTLSVFLVILDALGSARSLIEKVEPVPALLDAERLAVLPRVEHRNAGPVCRNFFAVIALPRELMLDFW